MNKLTNESYYDNNGNVIMDLRYLNSSNNIKIEYPSGKPCSKQGSSVSAIETGYTYIKELGNVLNKVIYKDYLMNPIEDESDFSGFELVYDSKGNIKSKKFYDGESKPSIQESYSYDINGNNTSVSYFDDLGSPIEKEGFFKLEWEHDLNGNRISESYFDLSNKPISNKKGVHRVSYIYDSFGNKSTHKYYGFENQLIYDDSGVAVRRYEHNAKGEYIKMEYLDIHEQPINSVTWKTSFTEYRYDDKGNMIEAKGYDKSGNPSYDDEGVFAIRHTFNDRGYISAIQLFDFDDNLKPNKYGIAKRTHQYDEMGNIIKRVYFNEKGEAIAFKDSGGIEGIYGVKDSFDINHNLVRRVYLGKDLNIGAISLVNGSRVVEIEYDNKNRETEKRYIARDSAMDNNSKVVEQIIYDDVNRIVTKKAFNALMEPFPQIEPNIYVIKEFYDTNDSQVKKKCFFDKGGKAINGDLEHCFVYEYDSFGDLTSRKKLNSIGEVTSEERWTYNRFRKTKDWEQREYDAKTGELVDISNEENEYDDFGNLILTIVKSGVDEEIEEKVSFQYDEKGYEISKSFIDINNVPTADKFGIHRYTYKRDEYGRLSEVRLFSTSLNPIIHSTNSYHGFKNKYDSKGNIIEQVKFDKKGEVLKVGDKVDWTVFNGIYNEIGQLVEAKFLDENRSLTHNSRGYAIRRQYYDEYGRLIGRKYFDKDDKATNLKNEGYHSEKNIFVGFNKIETKYFTKDDVEL